MDEWTCQQCDVVHVQSFEPVSCLACGSRAFWPPRREGFGEQRDAYGRRPLQDWPSMAESYPLLPCSATHARPFGIEDPPDTWTCVDAENGIYVERPLPRIIAPWAIDAVEAGIEALEAYANGELA